MEVLTMTMASAWQTLLDSPRFEDAARQAAEVAHHAARLARATPGRVESQDALEAVLVLQATLRRPDPQASASLRRRRLTAAIASASTALGKALRCPANEHPDRALDLAAELVAFECRGYGGRIARDAVSWPLVGAAANPRRRHYAEGFIDAMRLVQRAERYTASKVGTALAAMMRERQSQAVG